MSFPRYLDYKDSGVEWLGDVPAHWEVKRLKHNLRLLTEKTDRRDHPVALENIEGWTGRFIPTETEFQGEGIAFDTDDILFGKLRPYLAKAYRAESSGEAVGDFHVMRPVAGINSRFAQYQILNREFIAIVDGSTFGSKMPRASWEFVGGMKVTTPPLPEQTQIAAFLDRETAKIDGLVAEQRRLMELLKEKRKAVISHAVTQGLNPHAPMKPSGIEWLGDVPVHWEVSAIKRYADRITDGAHVSPETENGVFHFVSTKDVGADSIDFESCLRTSEKSFEYLVNTGCRPLMGDVLFSKDGTIGRTVVVREDRDFVVASSLIIIRPTIEILDSDFLNWLCQSLNIANQVECFVKGAGLPRLSIQNLTKVVGCFPPLAEQKTIAVFLDTEAAKFNTLTAEAQRAIDLLQERRTALISAAVTGQIDVR